MNEEQARPQGPENNIAITGDEARTLVLAMAESNAPVPMSMTISLYIRLLQLSRVQPPKQS